MGIHYVIVTVGWVKPETYNICFSGIQDGTVLMISTLGVNNDKCRLDYTEYPAKGIITIDACTAHTGEINCVIIEDDDSVEFVARKILKEHKRVFEELAK